MTATCMKVMWVLKREKDTFTYVSFRIVKKSDRCVITTTDQSTGERSQEPLKTLSTYRKVGNGVFFGMNCIPDGEGMLSVGEAVSVRP